MTTIIMNCTINSNSKSRSLHYKMSCLLHNGDSNISDQSPFISHGTKVEIASFAAALSASLGVTPKIKVGKTLSNFKIAKLMYF